MKVEELSLKIAQALRFSFDSFRECLGENEIIGYGILSHDTADSCIPVICTRDGLDDFSLGSPEDFIFSPVDWDNFDCGSSFDLVNRELNKIYEVGGDSIDPIWLTYKLRLSAALGLQFSDCARSCRVIFDLLNYQWSRDWESRLRRGD